MVFIACGMVWNAARLFHGRRILWWALSTGAAVWLGACLIPGFANAPVAPIVLGSGPVWCDDLGVRLGTAPRGRVLARGQAGDDGIGLFELGRGR